MFAGAAAAAAAAVVIAQEPTGATVAITNVMVIDGTGGLPRKNATVLIAGNRIAAIADTAAGEVAADNIVNGEGRSLIPACGTCIPTWPTSGT